MRWTYLLLMLAGLLAVTYREKLRFRQSRDVAGEAVKVKGEFPAPSTNTSPSPAPRMPETKEEIAATSEAENPEADQAVLDAMSDMEYMNAKWPAFRDSIYKNNLNLSTAELLLVQNLRNYYQEKFAALTNQLKIGAAGDKEQTIKEFAQQSATFDAGMEEIIGKEKFAALRQWKDFFNDEIRAQVRSGVEVNSFW